MSEQQHDGNEAREASSGEETRAEANVHHVPAEQQPQDRQSANPVRSLSPSEGSGLDGDSSSDEEALRAEDHLRPSLCIDDVGVSPDDKAPGAVPKRLVEIQQRPAEHAPRFETIYEMCRKFVQHFTTLHVERERDARGVYVCVACSSAQRTLAAIREAIRKDREGRRVALSNATFMKLLVQLCNIDSSDMPRICAVGSEEMREHYRMSSSCEIVGTATLLEGETSAKVWKRFFGDAANDIRKMTYAVKLRGHPREHGSGYDGVDAFLKQATRSKQPTVESNADPHTEADSLIVADCLDAKHVFVYHSLKAKEDATAMDALMAQYHQSALNREPPREPPNVGDVVGLVLSGDCIQRVLVVKVTEDVAVVWSIDHGRFHNIHWVNLIKVVPSLKSLAPAVALAIIDDVEAAPFPNLLRECVKVLRVVTYHDTYEETFHAFMVAKVMPFGTIDVLIDLLHCPDYVTRMTAAECLTIMCCRRSGRQAIATTCVPAVLLRLHDLTRSPHQGRDNESSLAMVTEEKRALIKLLQAMFFRNDQLLTECADTDLLAIVVRVHRSLPPTGDVHEDVERCLRVLLGRPQASRGPQQQQQHPDYCNRDQRYGCYRQGPGANSGVYRRQPPVYNRESAPPARAKLVAMTPEKLKDTAASSRYPTSEALQSAEAAADRPVLTQIPKPMANVPPSSACTGGAASAAPPGKRFYIRAMLVDLRSDETHEVRPVASMKQASARTLANVACSFLNTWKPCSIYYGISADGYVRGVILSQEDRDALRRGIDFMVGNLRPHLTSTSFGVEFVPVLRHAADKPEEAHHFVVEVWVRGVYRTVYTTSDGDCYLRAGDMSYQAGTYDVRAWIVRVEEEYYLQAKNKAVEKGEAAPGAEIKPLPVDDVMA